MEPLVRTFAVALVVFAGVGAATTSVGRTAPSSFELIFDGGHPADVHEGPFSASAPFCSAGYAADFPSQVTPPAVVRRLHTCSDGSGSITLRVTNPPDEHVAGGTGTWKILEGTGQYAQLRGKGTWRSSGSQGGETRFRSTLTGSVDFDTAAPEIVILRARPSKLLRPRGAYVLRTRFSARDNVAGNVVSYRVTVTAGGLSLASKTGATTSGLVSISSRIRPPKRSRRIRLTIEATDPLENTRTVRRSLNIRS